MSKEKNSFWLSVFGIIMFIYVVASQVLTLYFWWEMAKVDSFIVTILIDPFIAEIKGILWPFFIYN